MKTYQANAKGTRIECKLPRTRIQHILLTAAKDKEMLRSNNPRIANHI